MSVDQHVSPRLTMARLKELNVPSSALAEFSDLSPTQVSLWFAGERGLSLDAQLAVIRAMKFFEEIAEVAEANDTPVDFANTTALQRRWKKFLELRMENDLARTSAELAASNANAS